MLNLVKKFSCHIFLVLVPFFSFADNLQVPSIEFSNLNAALSSGDTIIIDARPAVFYELGHIPNAASLPLVNFEASFDRVNKEYNLKKFKQIIVYCSDRDCDDSDKLAIRDHKADILQRMALIGCPGAVGIGYIF